MPERVQPITNAFILCVDVVLNMYFPAFYFGVISHYYKYLYLIPIIVCSLLLLAFLKIVESPWYLHEKHSTIESKAAIEYISHFNHVTLPDFDLALPTHSPQGSLKQFFTHTHFMRNFFIMGLFYSALNFSFYLFYFYTKYLNGSVLTNYIFNASA